MKNKLTSTSKSRPSKKPPKERKYHRITWTERLIIEKHYNTPMGVYVKARDKPTYSAIAKLLNRSVSSIRYEIQKGIYLHRDGDTWKEIPRYSAEIAQQKTEWEQTIKGQSLKLGNNHKYAKYVSTQIKAGHSPQTIVQTLRKENKWTVSTPTLYRYIDEGLIPEITNNDLWEKPSRKRPYNKVRKASKPPRGLSIEQRPKQISRRTTPGHWEIDCVIGKAKGHNESVLTLTERKTRYEIILKLITRTAHEINTKLKALTSQYPPGTFQSITADNGSEFSDYETLKSIIPNVYYCHPYCSSERGTNERHNRIIRRFFPKKKSMKHITQNDCDHVASYMNAIPRKVLSFQTPEQLFQSFLLSLTP